MPAYRQRATVVSLEEADVYGSVSGQQGAAIRDQHAVPVQDAKRHRAGPAATSSHWHQGLCAHQDIHQEARTQSSGKTAGRIQKKQQELPRLQSGHPVHHGEQKRYLHSDTVAPTPTTFGGNATVASSVGSEDP